MAPRSVPPGGAIRLNAEAGPTTPSGLTREATEPMRPLEDRGAEAHEGKRHAFPSWCTWSYRRLDPL